MKHPIIILASASRVRSHILASCGIPHRVVVSAAEEIIEPKKGIRYNTVLNARIKAETVAANYSCGYVIGADSLVLFGKQIIGKPKNHTVARAWLKKFSGKSLFVYTGLCVYDCRQKKSVTAVTQSKVTVSKLSPREIKHFLKALGPFDKAGGFSIEGAGSFIFDTIKGSYYNILGLPTLTLYQLFGRLGVNLLDYNAISTK